MTNNRDEDTIPVLHRTKQNYKRSSNTVTEISLELLKPFKTHPFHPYEGKQLEPKIPVKL